MQSDKIIIRRTPFVFIKRLVIIEFFFALLPIGLAYFLNLFFSNFSDYYQQFQIARTISFNLFLAVLGTSFLILIIIIAFFSWYLPVYLIDRSQIIFQRGNLVSDRKLINTPAIIQVEVKQGRLAKRFDYGTLHITGSENQKNTRLVDIPDPFEYAPKIEAIADFVLIDQNKPETQSAVQLISGGEHQYVEYKASMAWDYYQERANKALHQPIMKTLVAFMNSSGGYLLIGVSDEGQVLGLEPDLKTLRKPTLDAFETAFNMAFNKMIGVEFRQFVDVAFPEIEKKQICILRIHPSTHPVFLVDKGGEKFYIRAGNASQSLTISQANRYIQRHFPDHI